MHAEVPFWSRARVGRAPTRVIYWLTARQAVRSALGWGLIFGLSVATSAVGYADAYKTAASRAAFAKAFGSNAGLDAITGPAVQIQTVAGYTVWKTLAFLSVLACVWGLTISTRLLRGEEEAGRMEVLLSGAYTKRRAARQIITGLATGAAVLFIVTALFAVDVGRVHSVGIPATSMVYFACAAVAGAAMFLALGSLLAEIAATRRQAATYGGAIIAMSYALRMVADSGSGLSWLRWTTPLGWIEELQPLTAPRPLALLPICVTTASAVLWALRIAQRRDLGASVLRDRSSATARMALLSGPLGLTIRLLRWTILGWMLVVSATALLLGFVAKQAGASLSSTPSIQRALAALGMHRAGASTYLGVAFLIVAVYIAFVGASSVVTMRAEEADTLVETFLVRSVSRWRWFAVRSSVMTVAVALCGGVAGLFAWLGVVSTHAGVSASALAEAGWNVVPPALCLVGISLLAFGVAPRSTPFVAYGVLLWSFLVELFGEALKLSHWIIDTSLFHQMAPAPAVAPDWTSSTALVAVAVATSLVGAVAFARRDLVPR